MFIIKNKKSLKIPKGGNQNLYIKEQTTQWPKDTKELGTKNSSEFKSWLVAILDCKIDVYCISTNHTSLRRQISDMLNKRSE
jgi:CRISPR/Cas system CSM-associated protein Csm4 (group 5 of RAMP superfamily)